MNRNLLAFLIFFVCSFTIGCALMILLSSFWLAEAIGISTLLTYYSVFNRIKYGTFNPLFFPSQPEQKTD